MKILLIRHGESIDDLTDQYGGWTDLELTPNGKSQLHHAADEISGLDISFGQILHSPLKRASQSAQIIGSKLRLPTSEYVWLKEWNRYGLFCRV